MPTRLWAEPQSKENDTPMNQNLKHDHLDDVENLPPASEVTAWMAHGNCRAYAPAVFFPSDGVGVERARKICRNCPVAETCLEYALENRIDHGVWGGASERERRRILKRRRIDIGTPA